MSWKEFLRPTVSKILLPILSIIYPIVNSYFTFNMSSYGLVLFPWTIFILFVPIAPFPTYLYALNIAIVFLVNAVLWYFISSWIITQKKINSDLGKFLILLIIVILNFTLNAYGIYTRM
jgi:hypothetical protein